MQTTDLQLIPQTIAQTAPGGFDMQIVIMLLIFVAFWFLLNDRFVLRIAENVKIEIAKDSVADKLD